MGTVVNTASIVQYHFIHDPALYVKKRLKDLRRRLIDGPIRTLDGKLVNLDGMGNRVVQRLQNAPADLQHVEHDRRPHDKRPYSCQAGW